MSENVQALYTGLCRYGPYHTLRMTSKYVAGFYLVRLSDSWVWVYDYNQQRKLFTAQSNEGRLANEGEIDEVTSGGIWDYKVFAEPPVGG